MNTPKCSTCRDTGHRDPSSFDLDCTDCDVAEQRAALNKFADEQKGVSLYQADRHWAIHQRALAMAPKQEVRMPTDICEYLREFADNNGYSHNDYADTMRAAADEMERYERQRQLMQHEINQLRAMLFPEKPDETTGWTIVPLKSIYHLLNLIDPPPIEANGKTMVFVNPHAAEAMTRISAEVRAMMAAKPSVDAQSGARGTA